MEQNLLSLNTHRLSGLTPMSTTLVEKLTVTQSISLHLMEPEAQLLGSHPEPDESSLQPQLLFLRFILILLSHIILCLGLPSRFSD
jgi:hypothetical protein